MRRAELALATLLSTVLLTACAAVTRAAPVTNVVAGYSLYYIDAQVGNSPIRVVDAATGRIERTLPLGTPSPDWSRLYAVSYAGGRTILRAVDTHSAVVTHQISMDGSFSLPYAAPSGLAGGLSPNGGWLALESQTIQNETSFVLVQTSFALHPRRISLSGSFSFDAISNDGQHLYLIESLAQTEPGHYRVRLYDVATGSLDPRLIIDKREIAAASMTGTRISGIFSPDGAWQYSLYLRENEGPFIHALNLDGMYAVCIDLPAGGDRYEQMMWSLAVKADGSALYAANPALGKVGVADVGSGGPIDLSRVASFKPLSGPSAAKSGGVIQADAKGIQLGSAALSRDERTLYATDSNGTVAIDSSSLTWRRQLLDGPYESVVLSQDGLWFFASSWSGPSVVRISPSSAAVVEILKTDTAWMLLRADFDR